MTNIIASRTGPTVGSRSLYAFLAEKERRTGSRRTVDAYAHGVGLSGRHPSAVTIGARLACVSSFYRFLARMEMVTSNPCDQLQRPKAPPGVLLKQRPDTAQERIFVVNPSLEQCTSSREAAKTQTVSSRISRLRVTRS
ncbi:MAG: hypothetical protein HYX92_07745 [Chloroflexi bacterium]|nr:hypothetical protein [Chloroflexota bacterium]